MREARLVRVGGKSHGKSHGKRVMVRVREARLVRVCKRVHACTCVRVYAGHDRGHNGACMY